MNGKIDWRWLRGLRLEDLSEDLIQLRSGRFIIDVGWYPEANPRGIFVCKIVKDEDWQLPMYEFSTNDLEGVRGFVSAAEWFIDHEACAASVLM